MKKNTFKKGWITGLFSFGILIFLAIGSFASCQENVDETFIPEMGSKQDEGIEYPIPENARVEVENVHFAKYVYKDFSEDNKVGEAGDIVDMIGESTYYLPKDIKNHDEYARLIKGNGSNDFRDFNILKVTIGYYNQHLGAFPIVKVELPSESEKRERVNWWNKSFSTSTKQPETRASKNLNMYMTLPKATEFFNRFWDLRCEKALMCPCLTFQFAANGCYVRAHYMRKIIEEEGYRCQKVFAYVNKYNRRPVLNADTRADCCVEWNWHVAPLVSTMQGKRVIDPSLCSKPVTIREWKDAMRSNCSNYGIANVLYKITPSSYYMRLGNGTYNYDDDYSDTYKTLNEYSTLSGCELEYWII